MGEHRSILIIGASIAVVVGILLVWVLAPSARNNVSSIPLTEISDTATIQNYLQLSHLSIATSENFARQRIYVISGYLKNVSDKPVRMAELKMAFTDFDGKSGRRICPVAGIIAFPSQKYRRSAIKVRPLGEDGAAKREPGSAKPQ